MPDHSFLRSLVRKGHREDSIRGEFFGFNKISKLVEIITFVLPHAGSCQYKERNISIFKGFFLWGIQILPLDSSLNP